MLLEAELKQLTCKGFLYIGSILSYTRTLLSLEHYLDFRALAISVEVGCAYCGPFKYDDAAIAKAESDFDESIQAMWPTRKCNGQLEIYAKPDAAALNFDDQNHYAIQSIFFQYVALLSGCQQYEMERRDK